MRPQIASQADAIGRSKAILNGMNAHEADMKAIGLDPAGLNALVDRFVQQEGRQEIARGEFHAATDELNATKAELKELIARITSSLEGRYGKTSPTLEDFGIAPRHLNPHKGPRAKAPAVNPANNNTPTNGPIAANIPASYNLPAQQRSEA